MLKILKFGGTSVGSATSLKSIFDIINNNHKNNHTLFVICSAINEITNKLLKSGCLAKNKNTTYKEILNEISDNHISMVKQLIDIDYQSNTIIKIDILLKNLNEVLHGIFLAGELSTKSQDLLLSFGEQLSCTIIADFLVNKGLPAKFVDSRTLIKTNSNFTNAQVEVEITNTNINNFGATINYIPIITGFIASNQENETTTLGRGGSDYTASIIGAGINANIIEIWTDVDGVMTSDPKIVKTARSIPFLTYREAIALSHFGAKIIYLPTLYPASAKKIPIYIKNTFNPHHNGTLIAAKNDINLTNHDLIKGISVIDNVAIINIEGTDISNNKPDILDKISKSLAINDTNIVLITQFLSEYSVCIATIASYAKLVEQFLNQEFSQDIELGRVNKIVAETGYSLISVVGENMQKQLGLAGKLFSACGNNGINIRAISQGSLDLSLSAVISSTFLDKALNTIHEAFFAENK